MFDVYSLKFCQSFQEIHLKLAYLYLLYYDKILKELKNKRSDEISSSLFVQKPNPFISVNQKHSVSLSQFLSGLREIAVGDHASFFASVVSFRNRLPPEWLWVKLYASSVWPEPPTWCRLFLQSNPLHNRRFLRDAHFKTLWSEKDFGVFFKFKAVHGVYFL